MKQGLFAAILMIVAFAVSLYVYLNLLPDYITKGGPLVVVLLMLSIMVFTYIFERLFSLRKAQGKGALTKFLKDVEDNLNSGDVNSAIEACNKQRGSMANVIRNGLERYQEVLKDSHIDAEKYMAEVQRAIEEATMLETPILEKNLIVLSTISSIATMIGLLGTVIGMIRAFQAMSHAGAPDAIQLSIGISEALVNTAGGLIAAITGIIAYNFFVNKVDNFTYMIDEATSSIIQILNSRRLEGR
ncbi:MAG: MotA/TolQ/ExbB proton channel family protein [Bacteroidetes bacterium]|jgi:biopolymer transport protein ExbB|nr:MotA/TolQ/ExbB proton channel family protein [Bacteroidota bacterium]MCL5268928.1 MotA/TolQ/ExbB proton channel family protein [Bacteroidota bacterium]